MRYGFVIGLFVFSGVMFKPLPVFAGWHPFVECSPRTTVGELLDDIESGVLGVNAFVTIEQFLDRVNRQGYHFASRQELEAAVTSIEVCTWGAETVPPIERVNEEGEFSSWHRGGAPPCAKTRDGIPELTAYIGDSAVFSLWCGNVIESDAQMSPSEESPPAVEESPAKKPLAPSTRIRTKLVETRGVIPGRRVWMGVGALAVPHTGPPITVMQIGRFPENVQP